MATKKEVEALANNFGSIDLLTACLMRNNNLSYKKARNLAEDMNGSDYIFDRFIEDFIDSEDV